MTECEDVCETRVKADNRIPIDMEGLLRWAYSQTSYVSYQNAKERSLAINHGYTAIPKGCHSLFTGADAEVTLKRTSQPDAKLIIAAVDALDPWSRAIIARCAKSDIRPDCFVGIEAREVEVRTYPKTRIKKGWKKKSHKTVITKRWEPCHPMAIRAAREIYARWHVAVERLSDDLTEHLSDWHITGFSAPEQPWE